MTGNEVRQSFIDFFKSRGHDFVPSASLVPAGDPTLLFTNAGMNQFKDVFLGAREARRTRARRTRRSACASAASTTTSRRSAATPTTTPSSRCSATGRSATTTRRRRSRWAWELLTDGLEAAEGPALGDRVYTTDDEAEALVAEGHRHRPERILRFGEKDNFWEMGETGPCGPCSEIHIDRGAAACDRQHVAGHDCAVNAGCARFIELWNLVFIQYNRDERRHARGAAGQARRHRHGPRAHHRGAAGRAEQLRHRSLARPHPLHRGAGAQAATARAANRTISFRVIADHSRALAFMIADGVRAVERGPRLRAAPDPAPRRAARQEPRARRAVPRGGSLARGRGLGRRLSGAASSAAHIEEIVRAEEERFGETLGQRPGAPRGGASRACERAATGCCPATVAFKLYDTYGFPLDLTEDILQADGIEVDRAGFERAMAEQRSRAREAQKAGGASAGTAPELRVRTPIVSRFAGDFVYEHESEILAVLVDGAEVDEAREGCEAALVVAETPFYGESGGQVGDRGVDRERARRPLRGHRHAKGGAALGRRRRGGDRPSRKGRSRRDSPRASVSGWRSTASAATPRA